MEAPINLKASAELVKALADQVDGAKLPKLSGLNGTSISINVVDGKLSWSVAVKHAVTHW